MKHLCTVILLAAPAAAQQSGDANLRHFQGLLQKKLAEKGSAASLPRRLVIAAANDRPCAIPLREMPIPDGARIRRVRPPAEKPLMPRAAVPAPPCR
ncbi:MAG: hypothetical protein R2729_18595 [Bryobacteraceae bacterium]